MNTPQRRDVGESCKGQNMIDDPTILGMDFEDLKQIT
jgi:hypothetical protein